jgi:hypothetical protein
LNPEPPEYDAGTKGVARGEEIRNSYRILTRKQLGKRPLGRPRTRCSYNIEIDLRKVGSVVQDLFQLRDFELVVLNLQVLTGNWIRK